MRKELNYLIEEKAVNLVICGREITNEQVLFKELIENFKADETKL